MLSKKHHDHEICMVPSLKCRIRNLKRHVGMHRNDDARSDSLSYHGGSPCRVMSFTISGDRGI